jgi:hypothetical protein
MKLFKILPAAAGVIALTATAYFAYDQRERKEDNFCITTIIDQDSTTNIDVISKNLFPGSTESENKNVYYVVIARGYRIWLVTVDAYTGRILDRRDTNIIFSV